MDAETDKVLSIDSAIALVLDAEQDALAKIEHCEQQADRMMRDTRQVIRGMVRRSEQRISHLHSGCAQRTRELVAELEAAALAEDSGTDREQGSRERLAAAVAEAARRLTTREDGGVD